MTANGREPLGAAVRQRRAELGLTQEDVAERTGLSVRAIADIEQGRTRQPRRSSARLLGDALGLDGLVASRPAPVSDPAAAGGLVVPRQLPPGIPGFAGRAAQLGELTRLLGQDDQQPGTSTVAVIGGLAGVGKTALAVHWAHRVSSRFPDGQLYTDLRGFGPGDPVLAAEAVCGFLEALGVPAARIPVRAAAQVGLYRSLLADQRVLVLLDNARDAAHVRPLLPSGPGCRALVTSRGQLTGLAVADGARLVPLDVLGRAEARDLLARRLGTARLAAEPRAAHALIRLTGGLPLALSITAARAAAHPGRPLALLAGELRDARGPSPVWHGGEASADLWAAFSWSYRQLSKPAARVFRLLGTHPGPDVTAAALASLAGRTPRAALRALTELAGAGLVTEHAVGRFCCHDLLRSYAAALSEESDTGRARAAARGRMLDHYLHTGYAGMLLIEAPDPAPLAPARAGVRPEDLGSQAQAMTWFQAEHEVLLAVAGQAVRHGFDRHAWLLLTVMVPYLNLSGRWLDWTVTQRTALAAAQRLGDLGAQARSHRYLGLALARLRRDHEAHSQLQRAFRLYCELGDQTGQAATLVKLGELLDYQQRHREALQHARRALDLVDAIGHRFGQAVAWNLMGRQHIQLGAPDQGIDCYQRALSLCPEGHGYISGDSWQGLGLAHRKLGRPADAIACYQQAVACYRQAGDRPGEGVSLARLGDVQHGAGELAAAAGSWREALRILADVHHPEAAAVRATYRQFCR